MKKLFALIGILGLLLVTPAMAVTSGTYNEQTDCRPALKEVVLVLKSDLSQEEKEAIIHEWANPTACCMSSFDHNSNWMIEKTELISGLFAYAKDKASMGCVVRLLFQYKDGVLAS